MTDADDPSVDTQTVAFYDENAEDYAVCAATEHGRDHLALFAADLPAGAKVLDFGAGEGWAAGLLAEDGFEVLAWDASEALLALAAARPGVETRQALFDELDESEAFDGVWASFSLLHAPRATLPEHLARIHEALVPGGRFFLGLKEGTGEKRDKLGRRYSYFSSDEVIEALSNAGFDILRATSADGESFVGATETFLYFHARRAE